MDVLVKIEVITLFEDRSSEFFNEKRERREKKVGQRLKPILTLPQSCINSIQSRNKIALTICLLDTKNTPRNRSLFFL